MSNISNKFALLAVTGTATAGTVFVAGARFLSMSENKDEGAATELGAMGIELVGVMTEGARMDDDPAAVGLKLLVEPPHAAPVVGPVANTPWGTFFLVAPAAEEALPDPPPTPPNRAAAIFSFSVNTFGLFSMGAPTRLVEAPEFDID